MDNNTYQNIIHQTDVENWENFLLPISVHNIKNIPYQCNNQIYLVPITEKIKELYFLKNKSELEFYFDSYLYENQIDLTKSFYFVKLSTVSGKDIIDTDDINSVNYWNSNNLSIKKLIIKSIAQLVTYLLESERIAENIAESAFLVFREWINFKSEEEFRCFIYKKRLVAISQYDYAEELPADLQQPDLIVKTISYFVDQIIELIPFHNVVLDVAVRFSDLNVYFIEFNSFGLKSDTDASLYDWVHDDDILCPKVFDKIDIRLFDLKYIEKKFQI